MQWFDGSDDDAADPVYFDTRSQITVDQLLRREGFRPAGPRPRRRALTGVAWVAVGAVVGAVLWHQPIGTFLTSGSPADATPDIAARPAGAADVAVQVAGRAGATAAASHGTRKATVPVAPSQPVLVVVPPSASTVSTKPRSHRDGHSRVSKPVVTMALEHVVTPVAHVPHVPHTPHTVPAVTAPAWTHHPSFGWFDGGVGHRSDGFGGGHGGGCGGRGH